MKKESNKNWTTCLRLNTGDGSPRVFLLNSHFLGSVPFLSFLTGGFLLRKIKKAVRRPLYQSEHWWSDLSTSLSDHKGAIAACSILNVLCKYIILKTF